MLKVYESIQNLDYLLCPKLSHDHSPLNLVCADCTCSDCSLLCIYCEQQNHEDHDTMPLKDYFKKVSIGSKMLLQAESNLRWLNQIERAKKQCVFFLQQFKEEVNDKIDQLIHEVHVQYQITGDKIKDIMTINAQLDNLILVYKNFCNFTANTQKQMRGASQGTKSSEDHWMNQSYETNLHKINLKIRQLMRHTAVESSSVNEEDGEQGVSCKQYHLACLSTQLKSASVLYSDKCRGIIKVLQKGSVEFQEGIIKMIGLQQQKIPSIIRSRSKKFTWSESIKANAIVIKDTIAERGTGSNIERFALFSQQLLPNVYSKQKIVWAMRVVKLVGWIGIGVCLRNKIVANNYKFTYESLGHGSYMLSSNGYTWSSSVQAMNSAYHSFSFTTGDFVILEFDGHPKWTLTIYTCKEQALLAKAKEGVKGATSVTILPKAIPKLKLTSESQPVCVSLSQLTKIQTLQLDESSDYYPCVNLSSVGDSVEIAS